MDDSIETPQRGTCSTLTPRSCHSEESEKRHQRSTWSKLEEENVRLSECVKKLEVQVNDLERERQLSKQPLPSLYVQLNSTRKALTEMENEKLFLGEKLNKKDQELQKIHHEQIQRMSTLEASINGVETHFERQISRHISKTNEQLQTLFQKASEMETTRQELETKTRDLEEAKKQVIELSEKNIILESEIIEVQNESGQVKESAAKKHASLVKEIETLKSTVSKLELDLQRQSKDNDSQENLEQLLKDNSDLKTELMEVSSKLVAMEEENDSMRSAADNQGDLLGQCLNLEEELQALRTINQDLEETLSSRKKRMERLQSELRRLRQQMDDIDSRGFGSRRRPLDNVSNQVDALVQAERRYEDLEKALANLRSERDALLQDKVSWNKTMHSLIKENKDLSKALNRYKSSMPRMEEKLEKANSKIMKLQAQVQVYALAHRHPSKGAFHASNLNEDVLNKLVRSQISLAEMDERVIKLRRELHKSVARNMFLMTKLSRIQKQCT